MKVEQGSVKSDLKNQQTGKSKTRHYKKRKEKKSNKVKCDKTKNNNKKTNNQTIKKTGHTKRVTPNVKRETHWWIKAYKQKYETVNVNTEELNTQEIN